jgi:hypothetical protein
MSVVCWGSDSHGQVSGMQEYSGLAVSGLALTYSGSCLLSAGGLLRCTGGMARYSTTLQNPRAADEPLAVMVGLPGASDFNCNSTLSCATLSAGLDVA